MRRKLRNGVGTEMLMRESWSFGSGYFCRKGFR